MAKWIFSGKGFDKGAAPYQDFSLLVATRNSIVHAKPLDKYEWTDERTLDLVNPIRILDRLAAKKLTREVPDNVKLSWLSKINTLAMAAWACDTARDMVRSIAAIIPNGPFKIAMDASAKAFEVEIKSQP